MVSKPRSERLGSAERVRNGSRAWLQGSALSSGPGTTQLAVQTAPLHRSCEVPSPGPWDSGPAPAKVTAGAVDEVPQNEVPAAAFSPGIKSHTTHTHTG